MYLGNDCALNEDLRQVKERERQSERGRQRERNLSA